MIYPAATRADHQKFCEREGWTVVRSARGRAGTHHLTYELALADGRVLRTRVSHPPDRSTYGPALWSHVLRDQLDVTDDVFWLCVKDGQLPDRGQALPPDSSIPADLIHQLIVKFRVPESEVAAMTKAQALSRLSELWSHEEPEG